MHPPRGVAVSRRLALAMALALLTTACADGSVGDGAESGASDGGDDGSVDDTASDAGTDEDMGTYWSLDADLLIEGGLVDAERSTIYLGRRRSGEQTCVDEVVPASVVAIEELPHETVLTWWEITWGVDALLCFEGGKGGASQPVLLGVGLMHPEIEAVVDSVEDVSDPQAAQALNGAYVQLAGDERLLVYGAAGPDLAWVGKGKPATSAPLSDGLWLVRTAYSLPLSW